MMEIEKRFAKADLSSLKEAPIRLFIKNCIQYQNFQTKKALERIDYRLTGWSETTATCMFDAIIAYIKYGSKGNGLLSQKALDIIDELVASKKYVPLTPAIDDARRFIARTQKKPQKHIIKKEMKTIIPKVIEHFLYAVSSGNILYTFNTEKEVNAFAQGVRFMNKDADIKIQKVTISED